MEYKCNESRDYRCAVAILLPSGLHERAQDIKVEVNGASTLCITVGWPADLSETCTMLRKFWEGAGVPKFDYRAPIIGGFHDALRALHPYRDGKHESTARIPLLFLVKPDPKRWLCTYKGTATKILIVQMDGPTGRFAKKNALTPPFIPV